MNYELFLASLGFSRHQFDLNLALKELTYFKTGGSADVFVRPHDSKQLSQLLKGITQELPKVPVFIWGDGSNLLVSDRGIRGLTIDMKSFKRQPTMSKKEDGIFNFDAGLLSSDIAMLTAANGFEGLEGFYGLPGTLGGACYMNARCYESEIADYLVGAHCLSYSGEYFYMENNRSDWAYKQSPFQDNKSVIISVDMQLEYKGQSEALVARAQSFMDDRTAKGHFKFPCAGSTFKNNFSFGKPTGQIIDSLQLKGYRLGGASISPYHANIFINDGQATSSDLLALIKEVQQRIYNAYGFHLEPEVIAVGEWD